MYTLVLFNYHYNHPLCILPICRVEQNSRTIVQIERSTINSKEHNCFKIVEKTTFVTDNYYANGKRQTLKSCIVS